MNTISTSGIKIRNGNRKQSEQTACPSKYPQGKFKDKLCQWCKTVRFSPSGPSHRYCSDDCKDLASTNNYFLKVYGITLSEVEEILIRQNYTCAICKGIGFKMRDCHKTPFSLDHCHKTGKVRGLLCHNCNRGLGLFKDNKDFLLRAAEYVSNI